MYSLYSGSVQSNQYGCHICLDSHKKRYNCQLRCWYCFKIHLKKDMQQGVCPNLKPYLNQLRQKTLCNVCDGQGFFNKLIQVSINSSIQAKIIYQLLEKDQKVLQLKIIEENIEQKNQKKEVYKIQYKRKEVVYQCPHCKGQKDLYWYKYKYCCNEHCQKCKYTGFILNQNWQDEENIMKDNCKNEQQKKQQQNKIEVIQDIKNNLNQQNKLDQNRQTKTKPRQNPSQQQIQKVQENKIKQVQDQKQKKLPIQNCKFFLIYIYGSHALTKFILILFLQLFFKFIFNIKENFDLFVLFKLIWFESQLVCKYCFRQHLREDYVDKVLCSIVAEKFCNQIRKFGTCKHCSGTRKQNKQIRETINTKIDKQWIRKFGKNTIIQKEWTKTYQQEKIQSKRFQDESLLQILQSFKQAWANSLHRMMNLRVQTKSKAVQFFESYYIHPKYLYSEPRQEQYNQLWEVQTVYEVVYQLIKQFVPCSKCKGTNKVSAYIICGQKNCFYGCKKCNFKFIVKNSNYAKLKKIISLQKWKQNQEQAVVCSICYQEMNPINEILTELGCEHVFHDQCLKGWKMVNQICPNCRKHIPNQNHQSD